MSAADCWPGPTNQKSVPGPSQRAVTRPPESVCSASSPCDIDPVAETMTPPRPGAVATELPAVFCADPGLPGGAAASGTDVVASLPGRLRLPTTAPAVALPVGDRRLMTACPVPAAAGALATATPPLVAPAEPGDGQALVAEDTATRLADRGTVVCATATGWWLSPAAPYSAATAASTAIARASRFRNRLLTRYLPRYLTQGRATAAAHRRPLSAAPPVPCPPPAAGPGRPRHRCPMSSPPGGPQPRPLRAAPPVPCPPAAAGPGRPRHRCPMSSPAGDPRAASPMTARSARPRTRRVSARTARPPVPAPRPAGCLPAVGTGPAGSTGSAAGTRPAAGTGLVRHIGTLRPQRAIHQTVTGLTAGAGRTRPRKARPSRAGADRPRHRGPNRRRGPRRGLPLGRPAPRAGPWCGWPAALRPSRGADWTCPRPAPAGPPGPPGRVARQPPPRRYPPAPPRLPPRLAAARDGG